MGATSMVPSMVKFEDLDRQDRALPFSWVKGSSMLSPGCIAAHISGSP